MGYYVSNMIGIRLGGVFSGKTDMEHLKTLISEVVLEMRESDDDPDLGDKKGDVSHCLSQELEAHKGCYAVLAGVFNYWTFPHVSIFAKKLSEKLGTEIMLMSWDEEIDSVQCQIYLGGKELFEIVENPIGKILRRIC